MSKKLNQLFKNIVEFPLPPQLERVILGAIELERKRLIKKKLIISYIGLIGSLVIALYTTLTFGNIFFKSDFWNIISLAFSDAGVVFGHWNDFMFSILETFPAITVAIILAPIFTFMLSIGSYLDLTNRNRHKPPRPRVYGSVGV